MKRKNAFFGVHFDFHALHGQTVGKDFRPDIVAKMLDEVKPDFAQCDTKGHEGLSSYATKIGTPADEIKHDVIRMWRDLTRERNIPLYAHHSGLYEVTVAKNHPDWAIKDENGVVSEKYISPFSPYVDEILIPQLKELCALYDFDGMWIDGDCWADYVDYSDYAVKAYKEATGKDAPKKADEGYVDYYEFNQKAFEAYVTKYITEVKKDFPNVEITSNWAYSSYMPSPINAPIDFISGDYDSANSVLSARYHGRCIAARNITWDLMAWGQHAIPGSWITTNRNTKEENQYCQEAAQIIALGGGFQFFNIMYGYGGVVQEWAIPMWKNVAQFCRQRQEFCFRSSLIPEVTVIYPNERPHIESEFLYPHWIYDGMNSVRGWINALQESGISSSVMYEYQLRDLDPEKLPVLILPNAYAMDDASVAALTDYVERGGKLIVEPECTKKLSKICGLTLTGYENEAPNFVDVSGELFAISNAYPVFESISASEATDLYTMNYYDDSRKPASYINEVGKGKVITLCFPLGALYNENNTTRIKRYVKNTVVSTGFEPKVEIEGSSYIEVVLAEKQGKTMINLLNVAGAHNVAGVRSYNEIPTLGPVKVKLRTNKKPKKVFAEPEHKRLRVKYKNAIAEFTIDRLEIHTVITVE